MPKSTFDPTTREGEHATIVRHTAVVGGATRGEPIEFDTRQPVRRFRIGKPERYAQHPTSVHILFMPPGKRNWASYTALPTNHTYYTIENANGVIYDSRQDVPCDMTEFAATRARFAKEWEAAGSTITASSRELIADPD